MLPVQLIILNEVKARLENISLLNEYISDRPKIVRARLEPFQQGDLPAINYWPIGDLLESKTHGFETRELGLAIEYHDLTYDKPFTDLAFEGGTDVLTALYRSTSLPKVSDVESPALGGLVNKIELNTITPMIGESQSPWAAVLLDITITYNVRLGDFFTIVNH